MVMSLTGPAGRRPIYNALKTNNLFHPFPGIWPYWCSPTIGRFADISKIDPSRFNAYVQLVDIMLGMLQKENLKINLTLHLPSKKVLMGVSIKGIVNCFEESEENGVLSKEKDTIRQEIIRRCFKPSQQTLDFRHLEYIDQKYKAILTKLA